MRLLHTALSLMIAFAANGQPDEQPADQPADRTSDQTHEARPDRFQPFPGITVDRSLRQVEVEGFVPVDVNQAETPDVIIEVIADAGGVRDHEALVGLHTKARDVHAALLLLGIEPGDPGTITFEGERIEPTGPAIHVRIAYVRDGVRIEADPIEWVTPRNPDRAELTTLEPRFVFGGSTTHEYRDQPIYMAAAEGVVVGLCTFGTESGRGVETVGMIPVLSPDTASGDPIWLARPDRVPPFETPVTLILRAAEVPDENEADGSGVDAQRE